MVAIVPAFAGGALTIFGMLFRNTIMQLIGGAILIYALGILHILPGWMIALLVILFIFLITKK